ncbi:ABC transporter permease [Salaquimonas pukyongi]|uniref:ABC transporter permease n=1 Tax=Salaquimonas pukyongi TaxID=2712698 RepID=UPI0009FA521B|nr:ABC transporter permease [Salaquimonas pukyongi]
MSGKNTPKDEFAASDAQEESFQLSAEPAGEGYSAAAEVGAVRKRRTRLERIWIELKKAPLTAWFGLIVIFIYCFVALFAPIIAPYGEAAVFPVPYAPWGSEHVFGTDQIGRDVFSRLIYGARNTMGIALVTTFLSFLIGGGLGLMAAINRSWLDQLISRAVDVLMAIPSLIFALMLLSIFGSTVWSLIGIIAVLDSTRVFRLTRSVAVNVVVMDYVEAARLRGEGLGWVMRREILPNIMPPLVAEFGLRFCFVFLTIAALSFLGVGIQPPTADWGSMVRDNASLIQFAQYDMTAALTPLLPAAAIALLTIAVNFVVDWFLHKTSGLRDDH